MPTSCAYSWADNFLTWAPWSSAAIQAFVLALYWPFLSTEFKNRKNTMESYVGLIPQPSQLSDLATEHWKVIRHVCSLWYAGRDFERLQNRYDTLKFVFPGIIPSMLILGTLLSTHLPERSVCVNLTTQHIVAGILWIVLVISVFVAFRLRYGIHQVFAETARGARGDL
jgi:hypothetical protein